MTDAGPGDATTHASLRVPSAQVSVRWLAQQLPALWCGEHVVLYTPATRDAEPRTFDGAGVDVTGRA